MVLLLNEADVRSLITMDLALQAVEEGFRGMADGTAANLPRRRIAMEGGMLHLMASMVGSLNAIGLKAYNTFGGRTDFLIPLYDSHTGRMLALIEGDWLGRMRTGAASGVATRYMARPEARTLGVFGAGGQARTQLLAICGVRPIERVHVYSRSTESRAAFVAEMQPQVNAELVPVDKPRLAVAGMDVIATMTSASQPVFDGGWIEPGTHINAAGCNHIRRREIDGETVTRAGRIAADWVEQAKMESGDLAQAVAEGRLRWEDVLEFSDIAGGKVPGRGSDQEITLFESQGISVWDVATAEKVYELAKASGVGTAIPLFD
jgi:ornithine cyclodeaminase/alanine dehydrogenase-like protein (mu-crystallin family)